MRFDGKVGVVTGGASGIGEGIVRRLVAEGGRCLIADVQEDRGRALAQELGEAARFVRADVSVEADVAAPRDPGRSSIPASTAGVRGGLGPHAYTAAKHAVVGLTESAAVELMPAGVRVNAEAQEWTANPGRRPL
jgi:NAD(P)-dependent dehydrogenase (short-subunit alcohol dehydrogenase family)